MFTKKQIKYIQETFHLNITDFSHLTDDEWIALEDAVGDRLRTHGFDSQYRPTVDGEMCESILDVIIKN